MHNWHMQSIAKPTLPLACLTSEASPLGHWLSNIWGTVGMGGGTVGMGVWYNGDGSLVV